MLGTEQDLDQTLASPAPVDRVLEPLDTLGQILHGAVNTTEAPGHPEEPHEQGHSECDPRNPLQVRAEAEWWVWAVWAV